MNKLIKLLGCLLLLTNYLISNCQLWTQMQRISNVNYGDLGYSMDFDGHFLISANGWRKAVIFRWKDSTWIENYIIETPGHDTLLSVNINNNWAALGTGMQDGIHPVYLYHYDGINWLYSSNISSPDLKSGDKFGNSISMNDQFMAIGADGEDDSTLNGGAVYIFKKNGLNWVFNQKIFPNNGSSEKNFGFCCAISANDLIIGAKNASYIYKWNGSSWIEQLKIPIQTSAVDITDKYAVVGSTSNTKIYVKNNDTWNFQQAFIGTKSNYNLLNEKLVSLFNESLIINSDFNYIFNCTSNLWIEIQRISIDNKYLTNSIIYKNQIFFSSPGDIPGYYDWDGIGPSTGAIYFFRYKLNQSIVFPPIQNKTYGANTFSIGVTSNSGLPVKLISNKESVAKILNNQIDINNAGTCEISAIQSGDSIYLPADTIKRTLIVNKAPIPAVANNFTKTYGDPNPNFIISYHDFVNGDDETDIDVYPLAQCSAMATSSVGTYPISVVGGLDNNYYFTYYNGELIINKATISVTAENKSRIYGDINPAFSINFLGFKNNENSDVINSWPQAFCGANILSDVGNYSILLSGGYDDNYEFNYNPGILTINKASLNAFAENKVKYYGDVNPPLTLTYTGFRNNDNQSKLDLVPSSSCSAGVNSDVGYYDIIVNDGLDNNYNFNYLNGQLLINKALLSVQAENKTKYFGEPNPEFTLHYGGFKNEDEASVLDELPVIFCDADTFSVVGNYPIIVSGGSDNNYQFFYVNGQLTISGVPTDINNTLGNDKLYFYPNPVDDKIHIVNSLGRVSHVILSSLSGKIIMDETIDNSYLELGSLPRGVYILDIEGKRFKLVKK